MAGPKVSIIKRFHCTYLDEVGASFTGLRICLDDMALFHWLVQNQECWLSTTKKLFNSHRTLFLVRGLGMRLGAWIIPRPHNVMRSCCFSLPLLQPEPTQSNSTQQSAGRLLPSCIWSWITLTLQLPRWVWQYSTTPKPWDHSNTDHVVEFKGHLIYCNS